MRCQALSLPIDGSALPSASVAAIVAVAPGGGSMATASGERPIAVPHSTQNLDPGPFKVPHRAQFIVNDPQVIAGQAGA